MLNIVASEIHRTKPLKPTETHPQPAGLSWNLRVQPVQRSMFFFLDEKDMFFTAKSSMFQVSGWKSSCSIPEILIYAEKSSFSYGFSSFSHGFPMVFDGFPMVFDGFPMVFDGFPMVFPWFSHGFPLVNPWPLRPLPFTRRRTGTLAETKVPRTLAGAISAM